MVATVGVIHHVPVVVEEIAMDNAHPATAVRIVEDVMVHVALVVTAVVTQVRTQIYSVASNIV